MTETSKIRGVQALYDAVVAYRDRVQLETDMFAAFDLDPENDSLSSLEPEDILFLLERDGDDPAKWNRVCDMLRWVWDNADCFPDTRVTALSNVLVRFPDAVRFAEWLQGLEWENGEDNWTSHNPLPSWWILSNFDALKRVWLTVHYGVGQQPQLKALRGVSAGTLHPLLADSAERGVPLDVMVLAGICELAQVYALDPRPDDLDSGERWDMIRAVRDAYCALLSVGVPDWCAYNELMRGYAVDADGRPVLGSFDTAAAVKDWTRWIDAGVPASLTDAQRAAGESLEDALDAIAVFRGLNAEGGFPFALAAAGLGVPEDTMTDADWNAWCANTDADLSVSSGTDDDQR